MEERNKARTTRRITVLTQTQIIPFKKICQNVMIELGSEKAAYEALGVSITVFRRFMSEDYLTDKMARIILDKRKAMKAARDQS